MSTLSRTAIAVILLVTSTAASACGTLGGSTAPAGGPDGTSSSGTGVSTSHGTASAAGTGTSFSYASASPGGPGVSTPPARPSTVSSTNSGAPTTGNQVPLGPAFQGSFDFGNVVFPQRKAQAFELVNGYTHVITIVSAVTSSTTFLVSHDCDSRELQPHDFCTISITFSPPSRHGKYVADLLVTIDPDGLVPSISMSGSEGLSVAPISTETAPVDNPSRQATGSPPPAGSGSPSA